MSNEFAKRFKVGSGLLVLILLAAPASASPVKLVAHYEPAGGHIGSPLKVEVHADQLLLSDVNGFKFRRITAQIDKALLQPGELQWLESFRVRILVRSSVLINPPTSEATIGADLTIPVDGTSVSGDEFSVITADRLTSALPFETFDIEVTAKFRSGALCEAERSIADAQERKRGPVPAATRDDLKLVAQGGDAGILIADAIQVSPGNGEPADRVLLFSFCRERRSAVNWSAYMEKAPASLSLEEFAPRLKADSNSQFAERSYRAHKEALFKQLRGRLPTLGFGKAPELVPAPEVESFSGTLVKLIETSSVAFFKDPVGRLVFREGSETLGHPEHRWPVIDQGSELSIGFVRDNEDSDRALNGLSGFKRLLDELEVDLETTDSNGNVIPKRLDLAPHGTRDALIKVALKDFLDREITLKAFVHLGTQRVELIHTGKHTIRNLGLITTFPLVSEIAGLVGRFNEKDQEASSTIPVSWAFNVSPGATATLAVTLPWIIGYNPRSAPQLASFIAGFAHLTLLMTEAGPRPAAGLGISVARFFQFSWAVGPDAAMSGQASHYLLVGLSIPDIAKLNSALSGLGH